MTESETRHAEPGNDLETRHAKRRQHVAVRRLADRWPLGLASSANRPVIDAVLARAGIID